MITTNPICLSITDRERVYLDSLSHDLRVKLGGRQHFRSATFRAALRFIHRIEDKYGREALVDHLAQAESESETKTE